MRPPRAGRRRAALPRQRALERAREEIERLSREIEETNRGVLALYAELDERAESLRRANDLKSRFLSDMTHEFRTPLSSILSLSQLLLDRTDGELSEEQERQVHYIRKSAEALSELVNNLLDLARIEAGKAAVRPAAFELTELFATLRGMLRPLVAPGGPALIFEEPAELPPLFTDEGKLAQILRNFISNALKFTEQGEVRVGARLAAPELLLLSVSDTGIGIEPQDQELIFEEFSQLEHPLQQRVRGTGLGLPLSRRLAELLCGEIGLRSEVGRGSTFFVLLPLRYPRDHAGRSAARREVLAALRGL